MVPKASCLAPLGSTPEEATEILRTSNIEVGSLLKRLDWFRAGLKGLGEREIWETEKKLMV